MLSTRGTGAPVNFSTLLAEGQAAGGFDPMMIVLLLMVVLMVVFMFRNRKKMAAQQEQRKTQMVPGAQVMTTAGIFGSVVSIDAEDNKVVLEVAPGQTMTFHTQAIANVVSSPAAEVPADSPADAAAARGETPSTQSAEDEGRDDEPGTDGTTGRA